jgi:hypothetical protein
MFTRAVIPSRFNGPPTTANGGYTSGLLATLIGDSAEVTLRKPPPLDRELAIEVVGESSEQQWRLLDGDLLIASARAAQPDVSIPAPVTFDGALAAEAAYEGFTSHHFPTCFVCGTQREVGDGLRLFTGKVDGRELVAAAWTPEPSIGNDDGYVDPIVVWSALDCPTYFAGRMKGYGQIAVLGRMTATLSTPIRVGAAYSVVAWPIGKDGRKWEGGSAIFSADGELCAFARGLWVELNP